MKKSVLLFRVKASKFGCPGWGHGMVGKVFSSNEEAVVKYGMVHLHCKICRIYGQRCSFAAAAVTLID
jgi:hypothetical protein